MSSTSSLILTLYPLHVLHLPNDRLSTSLLGKRISRDVVSSSSISRTGSGSGTATPMKVYDFASLAASGTATPLRIHEINEQPLQQQQQQQLLLQAQARAHAHAQSQQLQSQQAQSQLQLQLQPSSYDHEQEREEQEDRSRMLTKLSSSQQRLKTIIETLLPSLTM